MFLLFVEAKALLVSGPKGRPEETSSRDLRRGPDDGGDGGLGPGPYPGRDGDDGHDVTRARVLRAERMPGKRA
jgi:hypothetical protein